jgi:uncharacterized protein YbjT (DUF2867 family)
VTNRETTLPRNENLVPELNRPTNPVVIIGGTGKTGSRVASRLAQRGTPVRPVSRSSAVRFDWEDPTTWSAALDGASAAYITYSPDLAFPGAEQRIRGVAELLAERGISRVVLLSGRGEDGAAASERALLSVVPTATVVSCSFFTQNFTEGPFQPSVLDGHLAMPVSPLIGEPFLDVDDLAEVAVAVLSEGTHPGEILELTGPEAVTFPEVTEILRVEAGRTVAFEAISAPDYVAGAVAAGLPEEVAYGLAELFAEVLDGRNVKTTTTVEEILGRPATPVAVTIRRAAELGCFAEVS